MGTDIHLSIEVNVPLHVFADTSPHYIEYEWQRVQLPYIDPFYREMSLDEEVAPRKRERYREQQYQFGDLYSDRNYRLFAILSGVRNWYGFAIPSIAANRGLPEGECYGRDIKWNVETGWLHSVGWLTLEELLEEVDYDQSIDDCQQWIETFEWLRDAVFEGWPGDKVRILIGYDS